MTDFIDDPNIPDNSALWRRIPPAFIVFDDNSNRFRPSTQAFDNTSDEDGMSIYIEFIHTANNLTVGDILQEFPKFKIASFSAKLARELAQKIVKDPIEGAPAHGLVVGKKTKSIKRQFSQNSVWIEE